MKVRYLVEARRELQEALAYYSDLRPLVASNFVLLVRRVERDLAEYPPAGPTLSHGLHEHRLMGFRESLIFRADGDGILVVAIAHHAYRPGAVHLLREEGPR